MALQLGTQAALSPGVNRTQLEHIRDLLIERALIRVPGAEEGRVATACGPLPYRRIDAHGRVLAYLQLRPGRKGIRVDVAGCWPVPRDAPGAIPWSAGAASFWIKDPSHIDPVLQVLAGVVSSFSSREPSRPSALPAARWTA